VLNGTLNNFPYLDGLIQVRIPLTKMKDQMMKTRLPVFFLLISLFYAGHAMAASEKMTPSGPQVIGYGPHFTIDQDEPLNKSTVFKVAFDLGRQGTNEAVNRSIESLARFINMHVAYGIPKENIQLALVIHGPASFDMMSNEAYDEKYLVDNPNHGLLAELMKNNVDVYVCGQSAGFLGVKNSDLQSGIKMTISAMTTHALLQQKGYTLNPF
jgi:intracellular sulfur oxidation DsrE/DsrF family protein